MLELKPCTRLFIQYDGGYYPIPLDASTGLVFVPGTGGGILVHGGKSYSISAADPAATATSAAPGFRTELINALLTPVTTANPGDDLSTIMAKGRVGFLDLAPGHYDAFDVPEQE